MLIFITCNGPNIWLSIKVLVRGKSAILHNFTFLNGWINLKVVFKMKKRKLKKKLHEKNVISVASYCSRKIFNISNIPTEYQEAPSKFAVLFVSSKNDKLSKTEPGQRLYLIGLSTPKCPFCLCFYISIMLFWFSRLLCYAFFTLHVTPKRFAWNNRFVFCVLFFSSSHSRSSPLVKKPNYSVLCQFVVSLENSEERNSFLFSAPPGLCSCKPPTKWTTSTMPMSLT